MNRNLALDKLRGLLIVMMLVGHAISLFMGGAGSELWFRSHVTYSDSAAYVIRLINHMAAPGFFAILGIGMALLHHRWLAQGRRESAIVRYLLVRGTLLIFLQLTLINALWAIGEEQIPLRSISVGVLLNPFERLETFGVLIFIGVFFALGASMLVATALLRVPSIVLCVCGIIILTSPYLYLTAIDYEPGNPDWHWLLGPLAVPGRWSNSWVLYTVVPWCGLTFLGLVAGRLMLRDLDCFNRLMLRLGVMLIVGYFVILLLRALLGPEGQTLSEVVYLRRYPPEAALLLYAVGANCLVYRLLNDVKLGYIDTVLSLFGRSALFLYLAHMALYVGMVSIAGRQSDLVTALAYAILGMFLAFPACMVFRRVAGFIRQRIMWRSKQLSR